MKVRKGIFTGLAPVAMIRHTLPISSLSIPSTAALPVQDRKLRIIAFGAHPDDCDIKAGGTAAKFAALGHAVKFVSATNGDAGHQSEGGCVLANRRGAEAQESARRLGITYQVLDNHDGTLLPTIDVRQQIIRLIRQWQADIVLSPRPNDYHPDHRYLGTQVQDAAYMVVVPNICPDMPALRRNPTFFYFQDPFRNPSPFRPDVVVDIDDVFSKKIAAIDAHVSQVYEWLPWVDGNLDEVPKDLGERKKWLAAKYGSLVTPAVRKALKKWYGQGGRSVQNAEAFELCEYGSQPNEAELRCLFPMMR